MLQAIRDRASGWIAYIIVGLLIIPFALWGVNQYFGEAPPVDAAEVNDTPISLAEFQRAYQQRRQQLQNMLGDNFDPALLDETRLKREVLEQLVAERVLSQTARKRGFRVSDQQLAQALHSFEVFQQDGNFDRDRYQRVLAAQGYTPAGFEESLRRSLVSDQWRQGIVNSSVVTSSELERLIALLTQKRELSYVALPLDKYLDEVVVDEEAIKSFFEQNKNRFIDPEQIRVRYIELTVDELAKDIEVTEEELLKAYEEQKARYTREEQRSASHILVRAPIDADEAARETARARAQEMHDAIASGAKTFDQILADAQEAEDMEGGDLGVIDKGIMDPVFEDALFALENTGDISEPVRTGFGYHLIRLDGMTPAQIKPFEEVRDGIVQEVRRQKAETRFYDAAESLYNLTFEQPDSLELAAKALNLQIGETDWFSRLQGGSVATLPKVREAAFSEDVLKRGMNSAPLEVAPDRVIVVRLAEHKEASPRELDEAREDIVKALRHEQAREAILQDVQTIQARAEKGESLEKLAEEFGGEFKSAGLIARSNTELENAVVTQAFELPKPVEGKVSVGAVRLANGNHAVVAIGKVTPGQLSDLEEAEHTALAQRLATQAGAAQFESLVNSLRRNAEVVLYSDRL